jgi:hypothetical protein
MLQEAANFMIQHCGMGVIADRAYARSGNEAFRRSFGPQPGDAARHGIGLRHLSRRSARSLQAGNEGKRGCPP